MDICIYDGRRVLISRGHEDATAAGQVGRVTSVRWANHGREVDGRWRDIWIHLVTLTDGREVACNDGQLSKAD